MKQIGLFYGTYTGTTGNIAKRIAKELGEDKVAVHNICCEGDKMADYPLLIIGTSTWSVGALQEDWNNFMPKLENMNFEGKIVALFGTGDQVNYPDTF